MSLNYYFWTIVNSTLIVSLLKCLLMFSLSEIIALWFCGFMHEWKTIEWLFCFCYLFFERHKEPARDLPFQEKKMVVDVCSEPVCHLQVNKYWPLRRDVHKFPCHHFITQPFDSEWKHLIITITSVGYDGNEIWNHDTFQIMFGICKNI